jgi:hypothetical protein
MLEYWDYGNWEPAKKINIPIFHHSRFEAEIEASINPIYSQ